MPTYVYECNRCGHRFERFQRISDAPLKRCPQCRGAVRRVPAAGAGLLFKGSGFYITDYRSSSYRERARQEGGGKPGGGESGSKPPGGGSGSKPPGDGSGSKPPGGAGGPHSGGGGGPAGKSAGPKTPRTRE